MLSFKRRGQSPRDWFAVRCSKRRHRHPSPIRDSSGRPYAGALFKWVDRDLQAFALQFIGADHERSVRGAATSAPLLTRRELQSLNWGDVIGCSQAIDRAATLGYVDMGPSYN